MQKVLFGVAALVVLSAGAHADISFDSFGAGDSFNTGSGWTIAGASGSLGTDYNTGSRFTSATSGTVTTITAAIGYVNGTNTATLTLYADAGGTLGAALGSWALANLPSFGSGSTVVINAGNTASVAAGSDYWLICDSADDAWMAWNVNNQGLKADLYQSINNVPTYYTAIDTCAMRIETTPVPEPASMLAIGAGIAAFARKRRK